jgi:hypothetical protein
MPACHAGGRGFESRPVRQLFALGKPLLSWPACFLFTQFVYQDKETQKCETVDSFWDTPRSHKNGTTGKKLQCSSTLEVKACVTARHRQPNDMVEVVKSLHERVRQMARVSYRTGRRIQGFE